jgi:DNA replication protein DnaC
MKTGVSDIWASYNLPKKFAGARMDNYNPAHKSQESATQRCIEYAKNLDKIKQGTGLIFHGPYGTGKTHLAVATVYELIKNNPDQFVPRPGPWDYDNGFKNGMMFTFVSVVDLLATIREGFDGSDYKKGKAADLLHRVKCDEIVILDDIGAEKPSEWVEEQLYSLIDLRYRMERATIFTTNCSIPKELEQQIGERAVSRIFEMTEGIKVDGPDYRKRKLA